VAKNTNSKSGDKFITAEETKADGTVITVRVKLPREEEGEMLAIADELLGHSRLRAICADGESRIARIPGKMKRRRFWIREKDLIIVKPWDFQTEKCDVAYRYLRNQAIHLRNANFLPDLLDVF